MALIGRHRTNGYTGLSFGGSSLRLRSCILPAMSTAATTTIRPIVSVSMASALRMIAAAAVQSRRGHRTTIRQAGEIGQAAASTLPKCFPGAGSNGGLDILAK